MKYIGTKTKDKDEETRYEKDTKYETRLANIKTEVMSSSDSGSYEEPPMDVPWYPKGAETESGSDS